MLEYFLITTLIVQNHVFGNFHNLIIMGHYIFLPKMQKLNQFHLIRSRKKCFDPKINKRPKFCNKVKSFFVPARLPWNLHCPLCKSFECKNFIFCNRSLKKFVLQLSRNEKNLVTQLKQLEVKEIAFVKHR